MKRRPFVLTLKEGKREEGIRALQGLWDEIRPALEEKGVGNFSIWNIQDFLFCYGEYPDGVSPAFEGKEAWRQALSPCMELFAAPGDLSLMYHDIGVVRQDKSLIRHRVFATRLKEGCAGEYKRRHDELVAARGDNITQGPESNFTIWHGSGYIFGYCELVKSYDHEMTQEEKDSTIAWETRQLEIMDWLTDDVDWITGERHEQVRLVCHQ